MQAKGTIKAYSSSVNAGVIECENGKTYGFSQSEWAGKDAPAPAETVSFDGMDRIARNVKPKA